MSPFPKFPRLDRGRARGAKWTYVTPESDMIAYVAQPELTVSQKRKAAEARKAAGWILFRSKKEAKRWIWLLGAEKGGHIRNLRRQVDFPLTTVTSIAPTREVQVCKLRLDFVYERLVDDPDVGLPHWEVIYEDTKPGGGLREDVYVLKRKWFEAMYGETITET